MPPKSRARLEPREVPEAWSSEPDPAEQIDAGPASSGDATHAVDEEPSSRVGGRFRAVAGPALVTLAAGVLAFGGMRVILGGALERLGAAPSHGTLALVPSFDAPDAGAPGITKTSAPSSFEGAALDAGDAGAPSEARALGPGAPLDVKVSTELLDPPARPKLFPGHGLLEVRTWEPQRIYVDGVFVGNYSSRLVPLNPGTYHLRLAGARDIEQAVQVQAGRRTRVWARSASSE
jgi:hypothetical protein